MDMYFHIGRPYDTLNQSKSQRIPQPIVHKFLSAFGCPRESCKAVYAFANHVQSPFDKDQQHIDLPQGYM
jgi:hypothetical protein